LQALALLNDPVFIEAAQALALRMLQETYGTEAERIAYGFQLCLSRRPAPAEGDRLAAYLRQQIEVFRAEGSAKWLVPLTLDAMSADEAAGWVTLATVLLNLDEFITRE
jgi:hypothetical protein